VEDEASAEQEDERVGAPVDEREDTEAALGDVPALPGDDGYERPLVEPLDSDAETGDPASAGTQVVPQQRRSPLTAVGLRADFGAHLEANYQRLVAQLYAITLDPGEAHDVVQDAYSRAWRNWSTIGRSPDPSAWVRRVAVRSTVRSWRRALARIGIGRSRPIRDGVDPRTGALLAALGRLSPGERRAVVLFHMAGSSMEEIAAVEQASVGTVQARLARSRHVVTEGMADVLPAVLGDAAGDGYEADDYDPDLYADGEGGQQYGAEQYGAEQYGADQYGAEQYGADPYGGAEQYGTGGYSVDRYGTGGFATGGYGDAYGYEPGAGDNEGERR
jgi:RNA polymerase sigma-70 factor (ECF subfamily)